MRRIFFFLSLFLISLSIFTFEDKFFIEVKVKNSLDIQRLSSLNLDIAGMNRNENLVGIIATREDIERIRKNGFELSIRETSSRVEDASLDKYYTAEEVVSIINQISQNYPSICKVEKISDLLWEGNYVYAVKITKDVNEPNERPSFILDAQHHAREVMTSQIAVDMIDYLTSNYGKDPEVTNWVDNINIIVIPMVNPDGVNYVFTTNRWWRKNRNPQCAVDLNRNYDFNWNSCNGSSSFCYDETYRGSSPASENETKAMDRLMAENPAIFALSYHSYGEYILYPLGCGDPSDNEAFYETAMELNSILENDNGQTGMYATGPGWSTIYITDGTSDDNHYGKYGTFSYTIEVNSSAFQPDYDTWRDKTVQRQRTAWMFFLNKTLNSPRIEGYVRDSISNEPIEAFVDVSEVPLTNNEHRRHAFSNGYYFRQLPKNGTYTITFSYPGSCSETKEVTISDSKVILDVYLEPSGETPASNPIPENGAKNQKTSVTLNWQGNSSNYKLYFGENQNPPFFAETTSTNYTISNLEYGKTYYWRVDSEGNCGSSTGDLWSFSTYKYAITSVTPLFNPFRLSIIGMNFTDDTTVKINGNQVPSVKHKGATKLIAKGGKELKSMVPKGVEVKITVEDSEGGTSEEFSFTR